MIEVIRTKPYRNTLRLVTQEEDKKIAQDYYKHNLTPQDLSVKYKLKPQQIIGLLDSWIIKPKGRFKRRMNPITPKKKKNSNHLLMVNTKDMEFIIFLLNEYQVEFSIPENYKFEETFQSKINNKWKGAL